MTILIKLTTFLNNFKTLFYQYHHVFRSGDKLDVPLNLVINSAEEAAAALLAHHINSRPCKADLITRIFGYDKQLETTIPD